MPEPSRHSSDSSPTANETEKWDLVVIGGGLAGISAALESRKLHPDWKILVVESRRRLGGRAGSFIDPRNGNWVDNCQHVGLGCCSELLQFVERLGVPDAFRRVGQLKFLTPNGRVDTIRGSRLLPVPLHLVPSFVFLRYLSIWDKLTLGYGVLRLVLSADWKLERISVQDWLEKHWQTENATKRFWEPVLVSALNDSLDKLDCQHARKVFRECFFQERDGFHLLVPQVPLGVLFDEKVRIVFEKCNIQLHESQSCSEIGIRNRSFDTVLRNGDCFESTHLIVSTPWDITGKLMSQKDLEFCDHLQIKIQEIKPSPITGIHLVFDRKVVPFTEIALLNTTIQWVFDHTEADRLQPGNPLPADGQSLQVVVSASHRLAAMKRDEILSLVLSELKSAFPAVASAELLSSWVVTEHSATISPTPGIDAFRPPQKTPIPGLALAGDWTDTGWPSTMEGAIRSGVLAAKALTSDS